MHIFPNRSTAICLIAAIALPAWGSLAAQPQDPAAANIVVIGDPTIDMSTAVAGPEIKGVITARSSDKIMSRRLTARSR